MQNWMMTSCSVSIETLADRLGSGKYKAIERKDGSIVVIIWSNGYATQGKIIARGVKIQL